MSLNETHNTSFNFTSEEIERIKAITQEYQKISKDALRVQKSIDEAKQELAWVVDKAEKVKAKETSLFEEMSMKYDLDSKTLQNIAADQLLNGVI